MLIYFENLTARSLASGGGRKIIRVEISTDNGCNWIQADIKRFEKPTPAGKTWCWVHWDIELETKHFMYTKELMVRAWDTTQTNQPAEITWNVMGMMNNSFFRVRVHKYLKDDGEIGLRFQHPAPIEKGQFDSPGWRDEDRLLHLPTEGTFVTCTIYYKLCLAEHKWQLMV